MNTTVTSLVREDGSETKGAGEAASELSASSLLCLSRSVMVPENRNSMTIIVGVVGLLTFRV